MAMKEKKGGSEQGRHKGQGNNFEVVQTNLKFLYYRISQNLALLRKSLVLRIEYRHFN